MIKLPEIKYRLWAGIGIIAGISLLLTILLTNGSDPAGEETISPNGDPTGAFYSLAVLNRFGPGLNAETARGKEFYFQYCVICHGESGDGRGFNAYNLKSNFGVRPFDFTDSTAVARVTFDEVKKAIAFGGPAVNKSRYMPPWGGVLNEYDLNCLTSHVWHSLIKKEVFND